MPHLRVESLSKLFTLRMLGDRHMKALSGVSFEAHPGEFLGVVGRSGSGKSSLLRCVYRRYLPTAGSILYASKDGEVDLAVADDRTVLRLREEELGYVSQFLQVIPRTPAREVVAEPLVRRGLAPNGGADEGRRDDGDPGPADELSGRLSGHDERRGAAAGQPGAGVDSAPEAAAARRAYECFGPGDAPWPSRR